MISLASASSRPSPTICSGEPELAVAARDAVAAAAAVLAILGAPLLTVARETRGARLRLVPWSDALAPGCEIGRAADPRLAAPIAALRRDGGEICRLLSLRWPRNAVPAVVGVVTDGVGMAVSPGQPSALTTAWLTDQVGGGAPASTLVPFGCTGIGAMLSPMTTAAH